MVYGPCSKPLVIHLYAASVKCTPSQLTYCEGSSQALAKGLPHSADVLQLYVPPPPQHAVSAPPLNPIYDGHVASN